MAKEFPERTIYNIPGNSEGSLDYPYQLRLGRFIIESIAVVVDYFQSLDETKYIEHSSIIFEINPTTKTVKAFAKYKTQPINEQKSEFIVWKNYLEELGYNFIVDNAQ